ncbi:MAG: hypothetical protein U5L10_05580 [Candidatus Moranbacteria bacterium]|nr:hypothetical protein [Candidatus Moranbacteria bacterium]
MLFYFQPLIYTLVFFLALEALVLRYYWMDVAAWFLIIFTVLIIWPLTKKPRFVALPFFLSFGALTLLFFVDHFWEQQIFIILSSATYYLTILGGYRLRYYSCDQTALGMVNLATIATAFFWLTSAFAWFLNYQIENWIMMLFLLAAVFFISLPSFFICVLDRKKREKKAAFKGARKGSICCRKENLSFVSVIFLSLVLSFSISQLLWGIIFWPFSYLTLGASGLIIFYELWDLARVYLRGELSGKRIAFNLSLGALLLAGILLSAQWHLVV